MLNRLPTHKEPVNFTELFDFYHKYVKVLYSRIQAENELPVEVLFELNATLDHISRHWAYGETEEKAIKKAYSHLKRACLDVFKLRFKEIRDEYDELCKIDTSVIDNGDYDKELKLFFNRLRDQAAEARRLEGDLSNDAVPAFERWETVYRGCYEFEEKFYFHDRLDWAKKVESEKEKKQRAKEEEQKAESYKIGLKTGALTGLATGLITGLLIWIFGSWWQTGQLPSRSTPIPTPKPTAVSVQPTPTKKKQP